MRRSVSNWESCSAALLCLHSFYLRMYFGLLWYLWVSKKSHDSTHPTSKKYTQSAKTNTLNGYGNEPTCSLTNALLSPSFENSKQRKLLVPSTFNAIRLSSKSCFWIPEGFGTMPRTSNGHGQVQMFSWMCEKHTFCVSASWRAATKGWERDQVVNSGRAFKARLAMTSQLIAKYCKHPANIQQTWRFRGEIWRIASSVSTSQPFPRC